MHFSALPTDVVRAYQKGAADEYGLPPETTISDGDGNPCRHCLCDIPAGARMLILAYRPFAGRHAYAETGPIFLCADTCARHEGTTTPQILRTSPDYLLKGYCTADRIVYGTGAVVGRDQIRDHAKKTFQNPGVAYIHVRSARNNCYQLRMDRDLSHAPALGIKLQP